MTSKIYQGLTSPVRYLKGVGPNLSKLFANLGVKTIEDLIFFFPRAFEDRTKITPIKNIKPKDMVLINGSIRSVSLEKTKRNFSLLKASISDGQTSIIAVWFNQPFLQKIIVKDKPILIFGKAEFNSFSGTVEVMVRDYEVGPQRSQQGIVPVYSLTEGLYQKKVRQLIKTALDQYPDDIQDYLPAAIREKQGLLDLKDAILKFHLPKTIKDTEIARNRIVFDDFFVFQVGLAYRYNKNRSIGEGISFSAPDKTTQEFIKSLSFDLTDSQKKVLKEIYSDMQSGFVMSRLLQGDVGSGKTIVAVCAMLKAVENGYQTVIMAPTEILANQHFERIKQYVESLNIKTALLVSGISKKDKERSLEEIKKGQINIVVGTHAVLEGNVVFNKLGFVVIDEQQRFGVLQRETLTQKGYNPDVLVMTATPIPRTMALTLYGDLDRSVIDQMPPGRVPPQTHFVPKNKRKQSYEFMRQKIKSGSQVYIVCPLIEESEKMDLKAAKLEAEQLKEIFPEFNVMLLHGKMPSAEKGRIMQAFRDKKVDILVSTTVIEVGVDVPDANIMLIEHVERFGLSQMHQLRGRIGRGGWQAFCFLTGQPKTDEAKQRVKAMLDSSDGFYIAEQDLKIRGPGEVYGTRQAGLPSFRVADIIADEKVLRAARKDAFLLVLEDPKLSQPNNLALRKQLAGRYGRFLKLGVLN